MELGWITPSDGQLLQTITEQPPVRMELLPEWKQVIIESRQEQTTAVLLIAQLKRQRAALEEQVAVVRQKRCMLFDRWPSLLR